MKPSKQSQLMKSATDGLFPKTTSEKSDVNTNYDIHKKILAYDMQNKHVK